MPSNMYLKIESPNVNGETTDAKHKNQIEIQSFSHGTTQTASPTRSTSGGRTVERAHHSDFMVTKYVDSASTALMKNHWRGQHFAKMTLTCYRDGGNTPVEYLKILMEDVIISSMTVNGGAGDLPYENISLSYGKITYTYEPQDEHKGTAGGAMPASHDLETNTVQ